MIKFDVIHPELLCALAKCGHKSQLLIADSNYAHETIAPQCMESSAFNDAAWNPLHSIGMHFTTLHGVLCIQSQWMESNAFNMDAFYHSAWNPLHLITLHVIHGI